MKLVFIIGDAAVGKMTVGQELMKITDLRLFHNHMTIEPVIEIFGRYDGKTIAGMRDLIFTNFAASDNYEIRLQRNVTENRLKNKPSKRDIKASNQRLLNDDAAHRCVSREGEIPFNNYLRIENSDKEPETVAQMIKDAFHL